LSEHLGTFHLPFGPQVPFLLTQTGRYSLELGRMSRVLANLRLRTKFLLSLVLVTSGLTCATLLVVRHTARVRVEREIADQSRNAILTFQVVEQEQRIALGRKADLLATLALIRNGDASTIQDSGDALWESDGCDLTALADARNRIVALHQTTLAISVAEAESLLQRSLMQSTQFGWWYGAGRLYEIALQPVQEGAQQGARRIGTVVAGREIDVRTARDLARMSSSQIAFLYGSNIVVSTFSPFKEQELAQHLQNGSFPEQLKLGDELFYTRSVNLTPGVRPGVTLAVLESYNDAATFLEHLNHLLLGLGFVAVLAGGALVFVISDTFTRPLAKLVAGVRALEHGDFTYALQAEGGDEVAEVTRAFDGMRSTLKKNETTRNELELQLRQAQKMEAMGRLAGGVAHDFNNLLTIIKGHSSLLTEGLGQNNSLQRSSRQIEKAADHAASLTRQLLAFCRMQVLQPKVLELNTLVADMGQLLSRLVREDISFVFSPGKPLARVKADPGQIEQVILNLTVNACDAMPKGGSLNIETRNVTVDENYARMHPPMEPGRYVMLAVTDTGCGMDESTKARIFEPFFTTKELGKGTGLGLATVYGVVKQSCGFIWVDTQVGKGTRFEVYLPEVSESAESRAANEALMPLQRLVQTVLLAEDEEGVRDLAGEFLRAEGYVVLTAKDGVEAIAIGEHSGADVRLLVTDIVMPKMRGPELAGKLRHLLPNLKVVYMSGYLEHEHTGGEFVEDDFFLQKPFSREELVKKVREALSNAPSDKTPPTRSKLAALHSSRVVA
jgi:signal transduction histidine kinase